MAYKIIEEIGRGGMGCVYKAMDEAGNIVALKMMSNQVTCFPEYCKLFNEEVVALRRMNSTSVVRIVGDPYDDAEGNKYLPMEFINGETVEHYVKKNGAFEFSVALELMLEILEAMDHVHSHEIIHRDIKPSNIMLRSDAVYSLVKNTYTAPLTDVHSVGRVCIIDFGIAKDVKLGHTVHTVGRVIGTDGYMSPEQAGGYNIDSRTDIYSLGCLFYFMITGQPAVPNGKSNHETICNIFKHIPVLPSEAAPGIPKAIDEVIKKAVDKDMTRRYSTVKAFKEALEMAVGLAVPMVTIGRVDENDIVISHKDVSRRHLKVYGCTGSNIDGTKRSYIEVEDVGSTNGTGVNGRMLRKDKISIDYNGTVNFPEVFLAGRPELVLVWSDVVRALREKGWNPELQVAPHEEFTAGDAALSFFVPFKGWSMAANKRDKNPSYSTKATVWAWIGMVVYIVLLQVLTIVSIVLSL